MMHIKHMLKIMNYKKMISTLVKKAIFCFYLIEVDQCQDLE